MSLKPEQVRGDKGWTGKVWRRAVKAYTNRKRRRTEKRDPENAPKRTTRGWSW